MEEKYRDVMAISQSMIKDFKSMPPIEFKKIWITKEKEGKKSASLLRGSCVDDLLFNPTCIEDKYIICEVKKPSDAISFIVENVFDVEKTLGDLSDKIIEAAKITPMKDDKGKEKLGYGQGWKEDTLTEKVIKEGKDYFEFLKTTNGKAIISAKDYMASMMMADVVKKSEFCIPYLDPENNKFQFQIITAGDFPDNMKGALDILHINNKEGHLRIVDFKTAEWAYYFLTNVIKFGYLEQMAFYDMLVRIWRMGTEYEDYEILPPINIVIDKNYNIPYIYEYNPKDVEAAWGGYFKYGKWQKGIKEIINDIRFHVLNDKWDYPIEHYLYGKINLNLISHKND